MVFPVEIGLVDGEGIDEVLDLALDVAAQPRKVACERSGPVAAMRSATRRST
jgi:hypothetical protein